MEFELQLGEAHLHYQEVTLQFVDRRAPLARTRELLDDAAGYDAEVWRAGARAGWLDLAAGESDSAQDFVASGVVAERLGRSLFAGPFVSGSVVTQAISEVGSQELRDAVLPGLISGDTLAALPWPLNRSPQLSPLKVERCDGGYVLSGALSPVADARGADVVLVIAEGSDGTRLMVVPLRAPGVTVRPLSSFDVTRRFGHLEFANVEVGPSAVLGEPGRAGEIVGYLEMFANALLCAESVGATDRAFEITLEYARDRKAFGRTIGTFQALKHRMADMLLWLEGAKVATSAALEALATGDDASEWVGVACAYVADRTPVIAEECLQIHGGIGFTWEHDIHLYLRRIRSNALLLGGADPHYDRIGELLGV